MNQSDTEALKALVAKWREIADIIHRGNHDSTLMLERRAYMTCADRLHQVIELLKSARGTKT